MLVFPLTPHSTTHPHHSDNPATIVMHVCVISPGNNLGPGVFVMLKKVLSKLPNLTVLDLGGKCVLQFTRILC